MLGKLTRAYSTPFAERVGDFRNHFICEVGDGENYRTLKANAKGEAPFVEPFEAVDAGRNRPNWLKNLVESSRVKRVSENKFVLHESLPIRLSVNRRARCVKPRRVPTQQAFTPISNIENFSKKLRGRGAIPG
jgi:hypothetical protein